MAAIASSPFPTMGCQDVRPAVDACIRAIGVFPPTLEHNGFISKSAKPGVLHRLGKIRYVVHQ